MKVGFIGTGNMGGALAHAAAQSPAPAELLLSNRTPEKAQALARQLGATVSDNETIAQTCDYIFLGVKPQMMADLLARLRPILSRRQEGFVLVSMAAGLTLQRLREMAGLSCPILRIMPNTACAVGAGLTLYVPSPEVTELLLHRLGLVWTPEPEGLAPCWKALLSGSPNFDSLYEQLVQPRREILAFSPLAADALLLDAFYADEMRPLPVEWEPFLSTRQLALQRGLQGRWEEAVRLEPLPLLAAHHGEFLYAEGEYTAAIEVLREGGVLFAPAKAANAGGVAVSGLEMCQNSMRLAWTFDEVDQRLHQIMLDIFHNFYDASVEYGVPGNLLDGANIAGFRKVADAMLAQGVC